MFLKAILVFYNLVLTSALLFSGVRSAGTSADQVLLLFLLPVAVYFAFLLLGKIRGIRRVLVLPGLSAIKPLAFSLSLVTTSLWLSASLLGATNSSEYLFTLLILPLPLYFWGVAVGRLKKGLGKPRAEGDWTRGRMDEGTSRQVDEWTTGKEVAPAVAAPLSRDQVGEPQRRDFLKRIGGLGLGLLIYSILNPKQVGAAFFGSVPGPGTVSIKDTTDTKIDPAVKDYQALTKPYAISAIDDGTISYYGFIDKDGKWYILKEGPETGYDSYLYVKGDTNFSSNWGDREIRTDYAYFDQIF